MVVIEETITMFYSYEIVIAPNPLSPKPVHLNLPRFFCAFYLDTWKGSLWLVWFIHKPPDEGQLSLTRLLRDLCKATMLPKTLLLLHSLNYSTLKLKGCLVASLPFPRQRAKQTCFKYSLLTNASLEYQPFRTHGYFVYFSRSTSSFVDTMMEGIPSSFN